jgi:hypothetical protein
MKKDQLILAKKVAKALVAPVRRIGQGMVGIGVTGIGDDVLQGGKVPAVVVVALLVVGGLLWALADLAADETK